MGFASSCPVGARFVPTRFVATEEFELLPFGLKAGTESKFITGLSSGVEGETFSILPTFSTESREGAGGLS